MNYFEIFGLEPAFQIDVNELERRYRELQRTLHPDRHGKGAASTHERQLRLGHAITVNEAYRALRDDLGRATALVAYLGAPSVETGGTAMNEAFLMEVMDLREALATARRTKSIADLERLRVQVLSESEQVKHRLDALFTAVVPTKNATETQLDELQMLVGKLKYFRRFMQEADVVQEDIQS